MRQGQQASGPPFLRLPLLVSGLAGCRNIRNVYVSAGGISICQDYTEDWSQTLADVRAVLDKPFVKRQHRLPQFRLPREWILLELMQWSLQRWRVPKWGGFAVGGQLLFIFSTERDRATPPWEPQPAAKSNNDFVLDLVRQATAGSSSVARR